MSMVAAVASSHGQAPTGMLHNWTTVAQKRALTQARARCPELEPPAERPSAVAHTRVRAQAAACVKAAEGARVAGRSAWTRARAVPRSSRDGGDATTSPVARLPVDTVGNGTNTFADATFP